MVIYEVKCNACGFKLDTGTGGDMYVADDAGDRIICPHPSEFDTVEKVLGPNPAAELVQQRTGFLQAWFCQACRKVSRLDLQRDPRRCTHCGSEKGTPVNELIGKICPQCQAGSIELFDTGQVT